jgi:membrane peptidoglycan carboxypeptidase
VLPAAVAADVGTVLREVVAADGAVPGLDAAAKTGSQQWGNGDDSSDAWTAGFVPQLAAVTWVGRAEPGPARDAKKRPINGDGMPYAIWRDFLGAALAGQPAQTLPPPAYVGTPRLGDADYSGGKIGAVFDRTGALVDLPAVPGPEDEAGRIIAQQRALGQPGLSGGKATPPKTAPPQKDPPEKDPPQKDPPQKSATYGKPQRPQVPAPSASASNGAGLSDDERAALAENEAAEGRKATQNGP